MVLTQSRLLAEANKALNSIYTFGLGRLFAVESNNGDLSVYAPFQKGSTRAKAVIDMFGTIDKKLSQSQYIQNFKILYIKDDVGAYDASTYGFWITSWNNKKEEYKVYEMELALQMEALLNIQKKVLAKKEEMLPFVASMLDLKKSIKQDEEFEASHAITA